MAKKIIVQSVEATEDPVSDFVGMIDIIEIQLGIDTGEPSVSNRLDGVLADVRRGCALGDEQVGVLIDAVERLRRIESYLADFWGKSSKKTRA